MTTTIDLISALEGSIGDATRSCDRLSHFANEIQHSENQVSGLFSNQSIGQDCIIHLSEALTHTQSASQNIGYGATATIRQQINNIRK